MYKNAGYDGIIVTDHFYRGNTRLSRNMRWRVWVEQFCRGYEDAKREGDMRGLDVFFGWEETFDGNDDYLVYGLDKEWLMAHPEARSWTREEQYRIVSENGGCVVQAHPFRQRSYLSAICLSTGVVDAVEAANAGNEPEWDMLAKRYAERLGLPMTAGSDIHSTREAELFGVYLNKKMTSIQDYAAAVKTGAVVMKMPAGRCDWRVNADALPPVELPVEIRDGAGRIIPQELRDFLRAPKADDREE
jgi:hypothetical protein